MLCLASRSQTIGYLHAGNLLLADKQLGSLNEQTKTIMEICMKAAQAATKRAN
jgi:hypothetical protein